MPVHVEKHGKRWVIVERGGRIVGHSDTREKAQSSANARNAAKHGWSPTGKQARYKLAPRRPPGLHRR
jgi:hypothetical protein